MPARAKERKTGGTEEDISILPRKRKRMKNDQPPVSGYGRPNIALGAKAAAHHKIATYRTHGHIMSRLQKRRGFRVCMSRLIVFSPKTYTKEFPGADSDLQSTKDILYSPPIYRENHKIKKPRRTIWEQSEREISKHEQTGKSSQHESLNHQKIREKNGNNNQKKERKKARKLGNLTTCWGKGCKKSSGCWPNSATAWFPPSSMPACGAIACALSCNDNSTMRSEFLGELFCFPRRRRRRKNAPLRFFVVFFFFFLVAGFPFPSSFACVSFLHTPYSRFFRVIRVLLRPVLVPFCVRYTTYSVSSYSSSSFLRVLFVPFVVLMRFLSTYSFAPVSSPASRSLRRSLMIGNEYVPST